MRHSTFWSLSGVLTVISVFGNNAEETGQPPSVWRYYLLSQRPETSDSAFLWSSFIAANNTELLNNLGNFVNRVSLNLDTANGV